MSGIDRPSLLPRWASSPPASPPTTIVEPTSTQKDHGWQPSGSVAYPQGKPVRQHMNWWQNLAYQWQGWFSQIEYRTSDLHPDQVLPGVGSAPSTGVGLGPIAAGDFSASVYADGYRVPETDSPAHTYAANSDTYWDLRRDCVWVPTPVAAMAGAPAVAPNSVRVFAVRTDATDRTAIILDNLTGQTHIDFDQLMRFLGGLDLASLLQLGVDDDAGVVFDALNPRVSGEGRGLSGELYTQWKEFTHESAGVLEMRVYGPGSTGIANAWMMVWGARLQGHGVSAWITDANTSDAFRVMLEANPGTDRIQLRFSKVIGLGASTAFNEGDWQNESIATQQLELAGGIRVGALLNSDPGSPTVNQIAAIEYVRNDAEARYTLINEDRSSGVILRVYHSADVFTSGEEAYVRTYNAEWDEATGLWQRDDNAINADMVLDWGNGLYELMHSSAGSNTWADSISPTTWDLVRAQGLVSGTNRAISPAVFGSPFTGGNQFGYGAPIRCRRHFMAISGQQSVDDYSDVNSEGRFSVNLPSVSLNAGFWPSTTQTNDIELMIPIQLPHESTIVSCEVNLVAPGIDRIQVELNAIDGNNNQNGGAMWVPLQSGGPDGTWPSTGANREWHPVGGLDQFLTIDNQRYMYACTIRALANLQVLIWGIRIDYDVPYITGM